MLWTLKRFRKTADRATEAEFTMNEIVPDSLTRAWFSEPHGYNFNGYLVRHVEGTLCIDPVPVLSRNTNDEWTVE